MRLLLLALLSVMGCATLKKDKTVCPEYRDLVCMAGTECSMDATRGCRVCQCDSITPKSDQTGRQPDQRSPEPSRQ